MKPVLKCMRNKRLVCVSQSSVISVASNSSPSPGPSSKHCGVVYTSLETHSTGKIHYFCKRYKTSKPVWVVSVNSAMESYFSQVKWEQIWTLTWRLTELLQHTDVLTHSTKSSARTSTDVNEYSHKPVPVDLGPSLSNMGLQNLQVVCSQSDNNKRWFMGHSVSNHHTFGINHCSFELFGPLWHWLVKYLLQYI